MTVQQLRQKVVDAVLGWLGATMGSEKHYDILNTYNSHTPLARGYAIKPTDAYCAATVSAAWIKAGCASIAPLEISVPKMVALAKTMGIWVEDDAYVPKPGDAVVYDWEDDGKGDNQGYPDHVGIVERVGDGVISVIEGNKGSSHVVGRRSLSINGRYIRGFITPKFSEIAGPDKTVDELAAEVISGLWGNGADRRHRLTAAGYDYEAVQRRVNEILTANQQPQKPLYAEKYDRTIAGPYLVKASGGLSLCYGPGTRYGVIKRLYDNAIVRNYGYYSVRDGVKWYYVRVNNSDTVGFMSSQGLKRK